MKKGTGIGLNDVNGREIAVGDKVINLDSGIECTVNKYGNVVDASGVTHNKRRLQIIAEWHPGDDEAKKMKPEVTESVKPEPMKLEEEDVEILEMNGTTEPLAFDCFEDQELADELRRRGYTVTASKVVIVEQTITL